MPKRKKNITAQTKSDQIAELTSEVAALSVEAEELKKQVYRLKLEKDALQKAAEIIKKDQGISLETLSNREKAMVIDALRNTYSLKELLPVFQIAKSSYCYQRKALQSPDNMRMHVSNFVFLLLNRMNVTDIDVCTSV